MSNLNKFVTPKGVAQYPWLTKPDTKFSEEGVFKVSLAIPEGEAKDMPFKKDENGNIVFSFKSKLKPRLYDAAGKPIKEDVSVGGGSTIKVSGAFGPYNKGANTGVALYLNAVQIIDLVEFSSSPFGAEEGGFVAAAQEDDFSADTNEEVQF